MAALFFLAFAYFAVGQASVMRNGAQTAADATALGVARDARDEIADDFLAALNAGDVDKLKELLDGADRNGIGACAGAGGYAAQNRAQAIDCAGANGRYAVIIKTLATVGKSVVDGTEDIHATAKATALIQPRCTVGKPNGDAIMFTCDGRKLTVDPTADNFKLHLAEFFSVRLSE